MDIFLLISDCLQNFLGSAEWGAGKVLLRGLLRGRVGVWDVFVCCEKDGIDINFTRSRVCALRTHPTPLGLSYLTKMAPTALRMCKKLYTVLCYLSSRLVVLQLSRSLNVIVSSIFVFECRNQVSDQVRALHVSSERHGEQRQWVFALIETPVARSQRVYYP